MCSINVNDLLFTLYTAFDRDVNLRETVPDDEDAPAGPVDVLFQLDQVEVIVIAPERVLRQVWLGPGHRMHCSPSWGTTKAN